MQVEKIMVSVCAFWSDEICFSGLSLIITIFSSTLLLPVLWQNLKRLYSLTEKFLVLDYNYQGGYPQNPGYSGQPQAYPPGTYPPQGYYQQPPQGFPQQQPPPGGYPRQW